MPVFDALIIGGGAAGMQCALVLGSAKKASYASEKKIGVIFHQRSSHLQNALFNNVLGIPSNTTGNTILKMGREQLISTYPHVRLLENEKVLSVKKEPENFVIQTSRNIYFSKIVVLALNYSSPLTIEGLEDYVIPHQKANPEKNRIQLTHTDGLVTEGLYVCGTLAGVRSQFAIAAGTGAQIATDILTLWNNGSHSKVHDKV